MKKELYGELRVIGMKGCEQFVSQVDRYLKEWREDLKWDRLRQLC